MSNTEYEQLVANARAGKPDAQFLLSQLRGQAGDLDGMFSWLQKAGASGVPDALGALGFCYEKGQGVAADVAKALDYYDQAVTAGSRIAALHKAQLLHKSKTALEKTVLIRDLLYDAAGADVVPALRAVGYLALQQAATGKLAIGCLGRAASMGDPVSAFMLGWHLAGSGDEGQGSDAAYWLQLAAKANYPLAAEILASQSGKTVPTRPSATREAIEFDTELPLFPEASGSDPDVLCSDPPITLFKDVLTEADCAYLIYLSRPQMKRAQVIDPDGNEKGQVSGVRTSMSTYIPFEMVDIIGRYIELKIVSAGNEDLLSSEPMSILRYAPGEYYRPHVDYFNPKLEVSRELMQDGGQRTASAITYLTVPRVGGGTSFPRLDITVPPVAGGTLWFRNCLNNGQIDERSLHAGDTVVEGEKWVVTKWFREKPTQYMPI